MVAENEVLIIPPHLFRYNKIRYLPARRRTVLLSGWRDSEIGQRFRGDHAIAMSDHADFDELLQFARMVQPQKIYTMHGFEDFPKYLREIGFDAEYLRPMTQTGF